VVLEGHLLFIIFRSRTDRAVGRPGRCRSAAPRSIGDEPSRAPFSLRRPRRRFALQLGSLTLIPPDCRRRLCAQASCRFNDEAHEDGREYDPTRTPMELSSFFPLRSAAILRKRRSIIRLPDRSIALKEHHRFLWRSPGPSRGAGLLAGLL
jgi:hypothetical protein